MKKGRSKNEYENWKFCAVIVSIKLFMYYSLSFAKTF